MIPYNQFLTEFRLTWRYHHRLNRKLWHQNAIKAEDRDFLLRNAYAFVDFSGVSRSVIKDIILTGSNANFNFTAASDIDVHILCDPLAADSEDLYRLKVQWTAAMPLKLKGLPCEFYIQDDHEHLPEGQGVYSLLNNKWLISPVHLEHIDVLESPATGEKVKHYITRMRALIKSPDIAEIEAFKDKLHTMRGTGLHRDGEFSIENVLYKELRNRGWLDRLNSHYHALKG